MTRFKHIYYVIFTLLVLSSCVKEVTLQPFELPDLVQDFVRKVECFDQENAALIATDGGVLLLYGEEKEQVILDADRFPDLNLIDWENTEVLYSSATETFWVIQDSVFMTLDRSKRLNIHIDQTQFNISTSNYFDYVLSNEGELHRIGFYKELWAGSSSGFTTDLYIGIYKYLGNLNNTWEEYQTEMIIKSDNVSDPNSVFTADGDLLIATNPQYIVSSFTKSITEFTLIGKAGASFDYETMYMPYLNSTSGRLIGLERIPDINSPLQNILTTVVNENDVQLVSLESACQFPEFSRGVVKLVDNNADVARFYIRSSSSQPNGESNVLGYLLSYDLSNSNCDLLSIQASSELPNSSSIQDIDVLGNTVYIGTRNGLFIYDLETLAISGYINQLLEYYL